MVDHSQMSDILLEFIHVALHYLLYIRGIYPPNLFEKAQKYGLSILQCRHPLVNSYITTLLSAIKPDIDGGR